MNDYFNGVYFDYEADRLLCLHDLRKYRDNIDLSIEGFYDIWVETYLFTLLYKVKRG